MKRDRNALHWVERLDSLLERTCHRQVRKPIATSDRLPAANRMTAFGRDYPFANPDAAPNKRRI